MKELSWRRPPAAVTLIASMGLLALGRPAAAGVRERIDGLRTPAWTRATGADILSQIGTGGALPANGITTSVADCTMNVYENGKVIDVVTKPACDYSRKPCRLCLRQYYKYKQSQPTAVVDAQGRTHVTIGLCGEAEDAIAYLVKEADGRWNPALRLSVDGPCNWHEDGRTHKREWQGQRPGVGISKNGQRLHTWTDATSWSKLVGPIVFDGTLREGILDSPADAGNLWEFLQARLLGPASAALRARIPAVSEYRVSAHDDRLIDYSFATDDAYPRAAGDLRVDGTWVLQLPAFLAEVASTGEHTFLTVDRIDSAGTIYGDHHFVTTEPFAASEGSATSWPFEFMRLPEFALSALSTLGLEVPDTLPTRFTQSDITRAIDGLAGTSDLTEAIQQLVLVQNGVLAKGALTVRESQAVVKIAFSTLIALMQARTADPLKRTEIWLTDETVDLSIYPQGWAALVPRLTRKIAKLVAEARIETAFTRAQLQLNAYTEHLNLELEHLLGDAAFELVMAITRSAVERDLVSTDVWSTMQTVYDRARNDMGVVSPIFYHPFGDPGGDPEPFLSMELVLGAPRQVPAESRPPWVAEPLIKVPPHGTTTTTLQPSCGVGSCDDGDACTEDTCTAGGCVSTAAGGMPEILCRLENFHMDSCGSSMSTKLSKRIHKKVSGARQAASGALGASRPRKKVRLIRAALNQLAAVDGITIRASDRQKIAGACADEIMGQTTNVKDMLRNEAVSGN